MKQKNGQNGFTLIEVLLAMMILSVSLLSLASLSSTTVRNNAFSGNFTTATVLAQGKLEDMVNTSFGTVASGTETGVDENGDAGTGGIFTRTSTVTSISGSLKSITVAVSWVDANGDTRTATVSTRKSNY